MKLTIRLIVLLMLSSSLLGCNSEKSELLEKIKDKKQLIAETEREIEIAKQKLYDLNSIDQNDELCGTKLTVYAKSTDNLKTAIVVAETFVEKWKDQLLKMNLEYGSKYSK